MKCPKCGYISFDYSQTCPKCSKDIAAEQAKLNLPSFRPDTPYLLETLIGERDESDAGIGTGTFTDIEGDTAEFGSGADFDETGALDTEEVEFGDSLEIGETDTSIESEEGEDALSTFDFEESEPATNESEILFEESVTDFELESEQEGIAMDTGQISEQDLEPGEATIPESEATIPEAVEQEDELEIDLDDVSLDDFDLSDTLEEDEPERQEPVIDLDSPALRVEEAPEVAELWADEEESELDLGSPDSEAEEAASATDLWTDEGEEVELDLEDLTVDETGQLKVEETSEGENDLSLDLDDLDIDLDLDETEEKPS